MRYRSVSQCAGGSSFSASWRISSCSSGSVVSEMQTFNCHHAYSQNSHTERQHWWPAEGTGSHSSAGLLISRTYPNLVVEDLPVERSARSTVGMWLVLDKENSPKQTALRQKIPCSLLKKNKSLRNPYWREWFCTNNLQVQPWDSRRYWELCHQRLWLCPYYLEKSLLRRSDKPSIWPVFSTHGPLTPFQVCLVWLLHRRDAPGSQDAWERCSSWA